MQLGADSIVVSIQDELHKLKDKLETFWYTSTTGQGAKSLYQSMLLKKSFRVFRSSRLETQWAPPMKTKLTHQYRYDGLYTVKQCVSGDVRQRFEAPKDLCTLDTKYTFHIVRCDCEEGGNLLPTVELKGIIALARSVEGALVKPIRVK